MKLQWLRPDKILDHEEYRVQALKDIIGKHDLYVWCLEHFKEVTSTTFSFSVAYKILEKSLKTYLKCLEETFDWRVL